MDRGGLSENEVDRLGRAGVNVDHADRHEHAWAMDAMLELLPSSPEDAWRVILAAVAAANTDEQLCLIGCGWLEDLIDTCGPAFIDRIERQAHESVQFRHALSCVWAQDAAVRPRIDTLLRKLNEPLR